MLGLSVHSAFVCLLKLRNGIFGDEKEKKVCLNIRFRN